MGVGHRQSRDPPPVTTLTFPLAVRVVLALLLAADRLYAESSKRHSLVVEMRALLKLGETAGRYWWHRLETDELDSLHGVAVLCIMKC